MSVSTRFDGDPESCRRVARRLDGLAEAVERAGHFLARQAGLPPDDFEGLSGNAYRDSAGRLHGEAVAAAAAERALAVALDGLATSLDDVRRVLRRAHALARDNDLVVDGAEIHAPGPDATERRREVFRMVEGAVREARRVEDQAHHDWQAALARHTGTPAPPPLVTGPTGRPSPHPLPNPLPTRHRRPTHPTAPAPVPVAETASSTPAAGPVPAAATRGDDWAPPPPGADWAPAPPPAPGLISWEGPDGPR